MNERDTVTDRLLDEAWRSALLREQAPENFAAGVLARLDEAQRAKDRLRPWLSRLQAATLVNGWMRVAIAALLMLAIVLPFGYRLHQQAEMARGEAARQQVMLALRIAGTQLRSIQGRTQSIHIEAGILEGESQ